MLIEQSHRAWFVASLAVLLFGAALYVPYSLLSVTGASGGSVTGLVYAGIGSAMMVFAGVLGARKKYRIMRVGRATFWMRGHLWIGFLSFPFILFHSGFKLGNGALTEILMTLFIVVFVSGIFGATLQHYLPRQITQRVPMETVYGQIDHVLEQMTQDAATIVSDIVALIEQQIEREEATEELLQGVGKQATVIMTMNIPDDRVSKKISDFFDAQLKPYLTSRHTQKHPLANATQAATVFQQLKVLVPQNLWSKFDDLESICEEKRQLERQRWLHQILHGWLLFHVPASYGLLLLGTVHAIAALRY